MSSNPENNNTNTNTGAKRNNTIASNNYQPASVTNTNTVLGLHGALRYPFAPMNLGWLHEYVTALGSPERYVAMCRILECLMAIAVSTCDPFLEHAVVNFYTKFPAQAWSKVQSHQTSNGHSALDGMTFELSRQVFEVIGLIRRFPNATTKSRKMLLTLVERVLDDVTKVTSASPSMSTTRSIPEIVSSVKECVTTLKKLHSGGAVTSMNGTTGNTTTATTTEDQQQEKDKEQEQQEKTPEDEAKINAQIGESLQHLSSWLKYLFFALSSTRPVLMPACPPPPPGVQIMIPCSESCSCFSAFKNKFPVFLSDVEKVKVIDSLLISGHGATAEDEMFAFARELLQRYTIDFCSRAVSHVQNGQFALCRFYIFDALRIARRSQSIVSTAGITEDARALDLIEVALLRAQATCKHVVALSTVATSLVPKALASLSRVRNARNQLLFENSSTGDSGSKSKTEQHQRQQAPTSPATAELYALQKHLTSIFQALCNQQFLLCVHYIPQKFSFDDVDNENENEKAEEKEKQQENPKDNAVTSEEQNINTDKIPPPPPSASSQSPPPKPASLGPPKCANPSCGTTKGDLLKCSACKITWYCSRNCQQNDWKAHKPICKKVAEERQQQQQQSGFGLNSNNFNFKFLSGTHAGPTAAAAHWLAETCEKPIHREGMEVCEIRPVCF